MNSRHSSIATMHLICNEDKVGLTPTGGSHTDSCTPTTHVCGLKKHVSSAGTTIWYLSTQHIYQPHNHTGPAVVYATGVREWWNHGKLHNDNDPAVIHPDGSVEYYEHGKRHRACGPAVYMRHPITHHLQRIEWWRWGHRVSIHTFDPPFQHPSDYDYHASDGTPRPTCHDFIYVPLQ